MHLRRAPFVASARDVTERASALPLGRVERCLGRDALVGNVIIAAGISSRGAFSAFALGMTSLVSDVAVTARDIRRLTLVHSVLAAVFNIAVPALSSTIIASLIYPYTAA